MWYCVNVPEPQLRTTSCFFQCRQVSSEQELKIEKSMGEVLRVARLQNEVGAKNLFGATILLRIMLRIFPEMFRPLFCGSEKNRKILTKCPCEKSEKSLTSFCRQDVLHVLPLVESRAPAGAEVPPLLFVGFVFCLGSGTEMGCGRWRNGGKGRGRRLRPDRQ